MLIKMNARPNKTAGSMYFFTGEEGLSHSYLSRLYLARKDNDGEYGISCGDSDVGNPFNEDFDGMEVGNVV